MPWKNVNYVTLVHNSYNSLTVKIWDVSFIYSASESLTGGSDHHLGNLNWERNQHSAGVQPRSPDSPTGCDAHGGKNRRKDCKKKDCRRVRRNDAGNTANTVATGR